MNLLELNNIKKKFGRVVALDGVDLLINEGDIVGLVGESGSGKSTLGRIALRLINPDFGTIKFSGKDITHFKKGELVDFRKNVQVIFQDPFSSLNPRISVGNAVTEPLQVHDLVKKSEKRELAQQLFCMVGLDPKTVDRYPHQFSGGQKQRISIARAISLNPKLIIADEPVSSLDVSVQKDILDLMLELKEKSNLSYLFISHDLRIVKKLSNKIAVMYLGKIVEFFDSKDFFEICHPYTLALVSSVPVADPSRKTKRIKLSGDIPSPSNIPEGCRFHTRCPFKEAICEKEEPVLEDKGGGHFAACHFSEKTRNKL